VTVPTTTRLVDYPGDGSLDVFGFPFKIFQSGHLVVTLIDDSTGVGVVKTISTHYTVNGVGASNGGVVTMVTPPAVGETLQIERSPLAIQQTDLRNQGNFTPQSIENALDYIIMVVQAQLAVLVAGAGNIQPDYYTDSPETRPLAVAANKGLMYYVQNAGGNTRLETIYLKAGGGYARKIHWQTFD